MTIKYDHLYNNIVYLQVLCLNNITFTRTSMNHDYDIIIKLLLLLLYKRSGRKKNNVCSICPCSGVFINILWEEGRHKQKDQIIHSYNSYFPSQKNV